MKPHGVVIGTYFDRRKNREMPKLSDIKTNQIRNVFGAIKRVEMERTKEKKKEKPDFSKIERELEPV